MKHKIRFVCLTNSNEKISLCSEIEFPDFLENVDLNIFKYLDSANMNEFKQLNNINMIYCYSIVEDVDEEKRKSEYILERLWIHAKKNQKRYSEFREIYSRIKKDIKYKSEAKQINNVIDIYKASINETNINPEFKLREKKINPELEICAESASKYSTIYDWRVNCVEAYALAEKRGWLKQCTKHMEKISYARPISDVEVEKGKYYHGNSAFFNKPQGKVPNIVIENRINGVLEIILTTLTSNISEKKKYDELYKFIESYSFIKKNNKHNLYKEHVECIFAIFGLLLSNKWFDLVYLIEKRFINIKMIDLIFSKHPNANIYSNDSKIPTYILLYLTFVYYSNEYKNFNIHPLMKKKILMAVESPQFKELIQDKSILATH